MAVVSVDVQPKTQRKWLLFFAPIIGILGLWLASGWLVPSNLAPLTNKLQGLVTTFQGIFIEALPFLSAGVIVSVLIGEFVKPQHLASFVPKNAFGASIFGSLLGLLFPVCECGAIPTSRRLLRKGAPASMGIAFALAAPVVNPIVLISTSIAFGDVRWALARVGFTIIIALTIGLIIGAGIKREAILTPLALTPDVEHDHSHCDHDHGACDHSHEQPKGRLAGLIAHGSVEFFEMAQYLVMGSLLAATMQTFIPQSALLTLNDSGIGFFAPLLGIVVLMLVAVLLSVCSTVDAFLALSFLGLFHPGAVMAFLVFGPMIDIKSTLMLTTTFRRSAVLAMVVLAALFAIIAGLISYVVLI